MKTTLKSIIPLMIIILLSGCGAQKETTRTLEVSTGLIVSATAFNGGLIVYGEGPNGQKFSISNGVGSTVNVNLADGIWNIWMVGWESNQPYKFFSFGPTAKQFCGQSTIDFSSSTTSATISVTEANCITSNMMMRNLLTTSCGGFYQYNSSTNQYSPTISSDNFCSGLPKELQTNFKYTRVYPLNFAPGATTFTRGLPSGCTSLDTTIPDTLKLPMQKIPLGFKIYKTFEDCQAQNSAHYDFNFVNGIAAGNAGSFDSLLESSSTNARLVLPSNFTRRGKSPFMAEIPRILCGSSTSLTDCFADPTTNVKDINVRWDSGQGGWDEGTPILRTVPKNVSESAACSALSTGMNSSPYFIASDCKIDKGTLKAKFHRNEFTCRTATSFVGITDIYERDGKVYILQSGGTGSLRVYSPKGQLLQSVNIGPNYERITVAPSGDVYLADITGNIISKHSVDGNGNISYNPSTTINITAVNNYTDFAGWSEFEIIGPHIGPQYMVVGFNNSIKVFNLNDVVATPGSPVNAVSSATVTGMVKKLLYRDNTVWVLTDDGSNSYLYSIAENSITGSPTDIHNESGSITGFHVETLGGQKLVYTLDSLGALKAHNYTGGIWPIAPIISTTPSGSNFGRLIVKDNMIYFQEDASKYIVNYRLNPPSSLTQVSLSGTSSCTEFRTFTIGSMSFSKSLSSYQDDKAYHLINDLLRYVGRRSLSNAGSETFFQTLHHSHGGDPVNPGGKLGDVQEMLGPNGPGGIFSEFSSCTALLDAVNATSTVPKQIVKTITLADPFDGNQAKTYTIKAIKPVADAVDGFICHADANGACGSGNNYDLHLTHASLDGLDKGVIKLKCGQKLGRLENYENDSGKVRRKLLLWRTNHTATELSKMRFEEYSGEVEPAKTRTHATQLRKTTSNYFWVRDVSYEMEGGNHSAWISEIERNLFSVTDKIISGHVSIPRLLIANFNSSDGSGLNTPFAAISTVGLAIGNDTFNGLTSPIGAATASLIDVRASANSGEAFTTTGTPMSKGTGLGMSPVDVKANISNLTSTGSIFTLSP